MIDQFNILSNSPPNHDPSGGVGCDRSANPQIPWAGRIFLQLDIVRDDEMG